MNTLLHETETLRARYDEEPSHSDHVAFLVLQIFDALHHWHALEERPRELLHSAALLHDIGWSQTPDGRGHHKWSARLIQKHAWKGLDPEEVAIVAQIARYHRKALPGPSHDDFHSLPSPAQRLVMILGGILRVADALDRTHTGRVKKVTVQITGDQLEFRVTAKGDWEAEHAMFETKREMLEQAAGKSISCAAGD